MTKKVTVYNQDGTTAKKLLATTDKRDAENRVYWKDEKGNIYIVQRNYNRFTRQDNPIGWPISNEAFEELTNR